MAEVPRFHWADYLVFAMSLAASAAIGVFYGFCEKKNKTTADQLVGGRNMKAFPVALSCLASFLSAPFLIGIPAEIYFFGPMYGVIVFGYILSAPITNYGFVPTFHKLNLTSAYEYLERRFSKSVRVVASISFVLMMLFYMGVVVYAPARAFSQVTGLSELITILGLGVICTFYTAIGGMKAVIWTDVLQMIIILFGLIILVIKGTIDAGGPIRIANVAMEGGRLNFNHFEPSPSARHTWWTQTIGGTFIVLTITATNQAMIQRYLSIKTLKEAQNAVWIGLGALVLYLFLVMSLGYVLYAYYYLCDPLTSGQIRSSDQLVPLLMMETLGNLHGIPGLFTAAVFAATLSTLSSGVNALAAVILIDMIAPLYKFQAKKELSDNVSSIITKVLAVLLGFVTIGVAYLAPLLGSTLLQIAMSLFGMVGGPILGLFTLAVFVPCCNHWGALFGLLSSLIITFWISIGGVIYRVPSIILPVRKDNCSLAEMVISNLSLSSFTSAMPQFTTEATTQAIEEAVELQVEGFQAKDVYKLSYMWYSVMSVIICVLVGLIVSFFTGGTKEQVEQELVFDYRESCGGCCYKACGKRCCHYVEEDDDIKEISYQTYETKFQQKGKDYGIANDAFAQGTPEILSVQKLPPEGIKSLWC